MNKKNRYKNFLIILFLVVLGAILRLLCITLKPDGLWNDEYVSWQISSIPLGKAFWSAVFAQCHMPFYYFYLKFFMHFWGNGDLLLRLTSVFPGILAIISMYFVGKELKNEKLGILTAAVTSLSSFLIYFSQEVRFYELLFFFSSLLLIFTLKLLKKQNILNLFIFIICNLFVVFTHTLGFIFVIFNLVFVSYFLLKKDYLKKIVIWTWGILALFLVIGTPLLLKIFTTGNISQWWNDFAIAKIGFLFTDYFSPVLINLVSSPDKFFFNLSFYNVIFEIIPTVIAIAGLVKAIKTKNKKILGLSYVSLAFLLVLIIFSAFGKLVFLTKYTIEVYPTLILLMAFGLLEFKKNWRYILIFVYCFLSLFYIWTNPQSAPKVRRTQGHKIVADLLNSANLQKGDLILINYYDKDRFEKYFNFKDYNVVSINKGNFANYIGVNNKGAFKNINDDYFEKQFKNNIENKLKRNQKLVIIVMNDVSIISPMQMQILDANEKAYKKAPFFFLVFSYIKNKEIELGIKDFKITRMAQNGAWSLITFEKK